MVRPAGSIRKPAGRALPHQGLITRPLVATNYAVLPHLLLADRAEHLVVLTGTTEATAAPSSTASGTEGIAAIATSPAVVVVAVDVGFAAVAFVAVAIGVAGGTGAVAHPATA